MCFHVTHTHANHTEFRWWVMTLPLPLIWKILEEASWNTSCSSEGLTCVALKKKQFEKGNITNMYSTAKIPAHYQGLQLSGCLFRDTRMTDLMVSLLTSDDGGGLKKMLHLHCLTIRHVFPKTEYEHNWYKFKQSLNNNKHHRTLHSSRHVTVDCY